MNFEHFFECRSVFTLQEVELFLRSEGSCDRQALKLFLSRACRKGNMGRIRRGLYYVVPSDDSPKTCWVDLHLAAALMAWDAVLAYTSALEYHLDIDSPVTERVFFLTDRNVRPTHFRSFHFTPCATSRHLRRMDWENFAVEEDNRRPERVRLTSPERTLVDSLDRLSFCGGWRRLLPLLRQLRNLDLDLIVDYLKRCDSPSATVRVGWFLDKYDDYSDRSPLDYAHFHEHRPKQIRYLVPGERNGVLMPSWNLIVPRELEE